MNDAPPPGYYHHYTAFAKQNGYAQPDVWPLDLAAKNHAEGYPLKDSLWGYAHADYWAIEAELIVRTIVTDTWSDLEPDGKAFIAAWERTDR